MKAILMSIRPKWVIQILNGNKTIEIRKRFPLDYVGWVYIYHTKTKNPNEWLIPASAKRTKENDCSGKVVARFRCDKVEEIKFNILIKNNTYGVASVKENYTSSLSYHQLKKQACLTNNDFEKYFTHASVNNSVIGYAIHITKLEIFDKPKEISEFENYNMVREVELNANYYKGFDTSKITVVKKAPQSWFYVKIKE